MARSYSKLLDLSEDDGSLTLNYVLPPQVFRTARTEGFMLRELQVGRLGRLLVGCRNGAGCRKASHRADGGGKVSHEVGDIMDCMTCMDSMTDS